MKERKITFQDKQGRKIVGTLLIPDWNKPLPVVIICHGFKGNQNQTHIKTIAQELTRTGLVTLRFDFTNDPGESSLPFADMTISYEIEVLDQAIKFIKKEKEIDPDKIALTGHSLGGLVVAWYAALHPEISAICPLSAVYSFSQMWQYAFGEAMTQEMKEKGFAFVFSKHLNKRLKIKEGFYQDAINYDMDKVIDSLVCPILVVAGTADEAVTIDHAQHFYDRSFSRNKQLKIIKGSDHNYTREGNLDEVKTAVTLWFEKILIQS